MLTELKKHVKISPRAPMIYVYEFPLILSDFFLLKPRLGSLHTTCEKSQAWQN